MPQEHSVAIVGASILGWEYRDKEVSSPEFQDGYIPLIQRILKQMPSPQKEATYQIRIDEKGTVFIQTETKGRLVTSWSEPRKVTVIDPESSPQNVAEKLATDFKVGRKENTPVNIPSGRLDQLKMKLWNGLIHFLDNETAIGVDAVSIIRNTGRAINPEWSSIPILMSIGGYLGMLCGSWLTLKNFVLMLGFLVRGDFENAKIKGVNMISCLFYTLFAATMIAVVDGVFGTLVGPIFYTWVTLVNVCRLCKDIYFRWTLNTESKGDRPNDLIRALDWLQKQAGTTKEEKAVFSARTSGACYEDIHDQAASVIERLQSNDSAIQNLAIRQAKHLLEEVSEANFGNIGRDLGFLVIGLLGLAACFVPQIRLVSALFAIGAVVWLFVSDFVLASYEWTGNLPESITPKKVHFSLFNDTSRIAWRIHRLTPWGKSVEKAPVVAEVVKIIHSNKVKETINVQSELDKLRSGGVVKEKQNINSDDLQEMLLTLFSIKPERIKVSGSGRFSHTEGISLVGDSKQLLVSNIVDLFRTLENEGHQINFEFIYGTLTSKKLEAVIRDEKAVLENGILTVYTNQ